MESDGCYTGDATMPRQVWGVEYQAGQTGAEASNRAQNYADTHSPQQAEENEMGTKEKMRQMGVSPINVQYPHIYL